MAADTAGSLPAAYSVPRAFPLGWLMAELFDPRRRERQHAFTSAGTQLPVVSGLAEEDWQAVAIAELKDLLAPYARLPELLADPGSAAISSPALLEKLYALHRAILMELASDPVLLNGYELGITLSDVCFLPGLNAMDRGPSELFEVMQSANLATVHERLRRAGGDFHGLAAASVSQALQHWQSWVDVLAPRTLGCGCGIAGWSPMPWACRRRCGTRC